MRKAEGDPTQDIRVEAIRKDEKVGRGSCTSVDECWSDEDLIEALNCEKVTFENAVKWARKLEGVYLESGLNQRWGEDDDPQLLAWNEWNDDKEGF